MSGPEETRDEAPQGVVPPEIELRDESSSLTASPPKAQEAVGEGAHQRITAPPGALLGGRVSATVSRLLATGVLLLASIAGLFAFLSPFFPGQDPQRSPAAAVSAHSDDAPLIFLVALGLCLLVIITNLETRRMDSRLVAVLGLLVGLNASLRLITGPAGMSAVFFLPILAGFVLGADFGFLLGALSLLVSAVLTSGIGPWLPFQMFAAGWTGMIAGWIPQFPKRPRLELTLLALWGAAAGWLYGVVMNLWFWPFLMPPGGADEGIHWVAGSSWLEGVQAYLAFYLVTSLWWDTGRAVGNLVLILAIGAPILRLLRRFRGRFGFWVESTDRPDAG
ncbi:MAG: ECF transporter S component [Acidobacteriota bacterium]